jgi:hypothetical protein
VTLIAKVIGQLDLHRPLHQPLGQLRQQAAGPDDLLLAVRAGQQLVDEVVGKLGTKVALHRRQHPRRGRRLA